MNDAKNIIIIGGGGFAIECHRYVQDRARVLGDMNFRGFTATGERPSLAKYDLEKHYLGDYDKIDFNDDDYFVIGIGTPSVRKTIFEEFKAKGRKFANLVAVWDMVNDDALAESEGNIICPTSGFMGYKIGNGNLINSQSVCGHDTEIGDFNVISPYCHIAGNAKLGDLNFMGTHSAILPHGKIGNNNQIAAGSMVYKGCHDSCILQGNPAMKIGNVEL